MERTEMLELVIAGGWVMVPILLLAIASLGICIERLWTLRRREVLPVGLGDEVRQWARGRQLDPQHIEVLRTNSALGALLAAALDVRHRSRDLIKERVEDVGRHVLHDLERFLPTLGTIAAVSPLLGLLGTVFGMITMFLGILDAGVGDANRLAGGIGQALISTAAGLLVAIPSLVMHRYFRARVAGFVVDMEKEAIALVDAIDEHAVAGRAKGKGAQA